MTEKKKLSLGLALLPLVFLLSLLVINVILFKDDSSSGPNQIALLLTGLLTIVFGVFHLKIPYAEMEKKAIESISSAMQACLILLAVGSLIGLWILSGVVPTMIYFGLELINPSFFLPIACITCVFVSLSTGTSWGTTGTVGLALIGIGQTLGIPLGMVAGAVISGSYFGDKMSPLSDTTNLAPAMVGTDLFTHIRHMVYTSGPSIILSIIGFFFLSFFYRSDLATPEEIQKTLNVLQAEFNISGALLLVPLAVIVLVIRKVPALPAIFVGGALGAVAAIFAQPDVLNRLAAGGASIGTTYMEILRVAYDGFQIESGHKTVDSLLNRGGMSSMLSAVWLVLMSMFMGGTFEATGVLQRLAEAILQWVRGVGSLVGATLASCVFVNMTACDQYLAIVLPGRMFKKAYDDQGLHPKNLSRALEDSGTVTSVLVPWSSGGVYHAGVLGVATLTYLPFCFFNLLSPLVSLFLASMNWTIEKKLNA